MISPDAAFSRGSSLLTTSYGSLCERGLSAGEEHPLYLAKVESEPGGQAVVP